MVRTEGRFYLSLFKIDHYEDHPENFIDRSGSNYLRVHSSRYHREELLVGRTGCCCFEFTKFVYQAHIGSTYVSYYHRDSRLIFIGDKCCNYNDGRLFYRRFYRKKYLVGTGL